MTQDEQLELSHPAPPIDSHSVHTNNHENLQQLIIINHQPQLHQPQPSEQQQLPQIHDDSLNSKNINNSNNNNIICKLNDANDLNCFYGSDRVGDNMNGTCSNSTTSAFHLGENKNDIIATSNSECESNIIITDVVINSENHNSTHHPQLSIQVQDDTIILPSTTTLRKIEILPKTDSDLEQNSTLEVVPVVVCSTKTVPANEPIKNIENKSVQNSSTETQQHQIELDGERNSLSSSSSSSVIGTNQEKIVCGVGDSLDSILNDNMTVVKTQNNSDNIRLNIVEISDLKDFNNNAAAAAISANNLTNNTNSILTNTINVNSNQLNQFKLTDAVNDKQISSSSASTINDQNRLQNIQGEEDDNQTNKSLVIKCDDTGGGGGDDVAPTTSQLINTTKSLIRNQSENKLKKTSITNDKEDPIVRLNKLRANITNALREVKGVLRQYSSEQSIDLEDNNNQQRNSQMAPVADDSTVKFRFVRKIRRRSQLSEDDMNRVQSDHEMIHDKKLELIAEIKPSAPELLVADSLQNVASSVDVVDNVDVVRPSIDNKSKKKLTSIDEVDDDDIKLKKKLKKTTVVIDKDDSNEEKPKKKLKKQSSIDKDAKTQLKDKTEETTKKKVKKVECIESDSKVPSTVAVQSSSDDKPKKSKLKKQESLENDAVVKKKTSSSTKVETNVSPKPLKKLLKKQEAVSSDSSSNIASVEKKLDPVAVVKPVPIVPNILSIIPSQTIAKAKTIVDLLKPIMKPEPSATSSELNKRTPDIPKSLESIPDVILNEEISNISENQPKLPTATIIAIQKTPQKSPPKESILETQNTDHLDSSTSTKTSEPKIKSKPIEIIATPPSKEIGTLNDSAETAKYKVASAIPGILPINESLLDRRASIASGEFKKVTELNLTPQIEIAAVQRSLSDSEIIPKQPVTPLNESNSTVSNSSSPTPKSDVTKSPQSAVDDAKNMIENEPLVTNENNQAIIADDTQPEIETPDEEVPISPRVPKDDLAKKLEKLKKDSQDHTDHDSDIIEDIKADDDDEEDEEGATAAAGTVAAVKEPKKRKAKKKVVIKRIKRKLSIVEGFGNAPPQADECEPEICEKEIFKDDDEEEKEEEDEVPVVKPLPKSCLKVRAYEPGDLVMYADRIKKTQVKWRQASVVERITSISYKLNIEGEEKTAHLSYIKKYTGKKLTFGGKEYLEIDYAQIEADEEEEKNYSIWNMV